MDCMFRNRLDKQLNFIVLLKLFHCDIHAADARLPSPDYYYYLGREASRVLSAVFQYIDLFLRVI